MIPQRLLQPVDASYSYHAGWVTADGTLHSTVSHSAFKPRGYITANRKWQKEQRAERRARGRWYPGCGVGCLSNYSFNWDRGSLRLCVYRDKVSVEYSTYISGTEQERPPITQVLTDAQCISLANLCATLKRPLEVHYGGRGGNKHKVIPHTRLHGPADIKEVLT